MTRRKPLADPLMAPVAAEDDAVARPLWHAAGFLAFRLLKGPDDGETWLYASHSTWATRADFDAWRESEAFHRAHAQAKAPAGTYAGHPVFEGFDVLLEEVADAV